MPNSVVKRAPRQQHFYRCAIAALLTTFSSSFWLGSQPVKAATGDYCRFTAEAVAEKENLRQKSVKGNADAQKNYKQILKAHNDELNRCRERTWPQVQAVWLRVYPCDIRPGALDEIFDRIVNSGYNHVYLESFAGGQVLLPSAENSTVWPSLIRAKGKEKADLLALAIQKGHERGLKVYAWMFSMNVGYNYVERSDRQEAIARNGKGQSSLDVVEEGNQVFIDPYNRQAQIDYYRLVEAIVKRRPDGVLFDYIRYPRQSGSNSVVSKVQDLFIYSNASKQALLERALNNKGRNLIQQFFSRGFISAQDIEAVDKLYPGEGSPLWQGRTPPADELKFTAAQRQPLVQWELWQLSVAHAVQGVLDFLSIASLAAERQQVPAGAVFFPDANIAIGEGFDSRLQAWDRFPGSLEWHPMAYAVCGYANCVAGQVRRVSNMAPPGTVVIPAIAGVWGQNLSDRPSLEEQMRAIKYWAPQVNAVSHFAYSWQYPESDRDRKFCRLE